MATPAASSNNHFLRLWSYARLHLLVCLLGVIALILLAFSNTAFLVLIKHVTDEGFVKQSASNLAYLPLLLFALFASYFSQAQGETMANTMRSNGKIYVVVAVLTTILVGLIAYLVRLDKKISKLEKE